MNAIEYRKWLRLLLLAAGTIMLFAVLPVFFPISLMASIHEKLGLGEFPDRPITAYLARSTSMLYVAHGTLIVCLAMRMDQHWNLVPVIGWLHFGMGAVLLGTDLSAGMPWYWTGLEGVPIACAGLLIVWLWKKSESQMKQQAGH